MPASRQMQFYRQIPRDPLLAMSWALMGRPEDEPLPGQPRRSDAPRRLIAGTAAAAP